jgi:predicted dehydrogenase
MGAMEHARAGADTPARGQGVVRVGVVGTGFGAEVHVPGWQACPGATVVAIASRQRTRAEAVARAAGVPFATDDYRALLERVDLVSIATPPTLHYPMVLAALAAGKHVLCEKPFAASLSEARAMVRAATAAGVVHGVVHEFRYLPARAHFGALLAQGHVGTPFLVRATDLQGRALRGGQPAWWYARAAAGGLLGAAGSHYLDALRGWCGDLAAVAAVLDTVAPRFTPRLAHLPADVSADDTLTVLLRFANGAQGTLQLSACARVPLKRVEVYGTAGTLVLEDDARVLGAQGDAPLAPLPLPADLAPPAGVDRRVAAFVALAERLVARIDGGDAGPYPTFEDGLHVQAAMEAAQRAAASGRFEAVTP